MKPDDPNVGPVLEGLTWKSLREMNAARRQAEMPVEKTPDLLTQRQAAAMIGETVSNLKHWVRYGKIPTVKCGKHKYYEPEELMKAYRAIDRRRGPK